MPRPLVVRACEREDTRLLVNEALPLSDGASLFGTDDSLAGPAFRDSLSRSDPTIRAVISEHTHGGQVTIGGWAPLRLPASGDHVSGWYMDNGPDLFVSRGIGTSLVPVRLGSIPELALIDWYPRSV